MGKKKNGEGARLSGSSRSIREEAAGKLNKKVGARNPRSFLKLEHLRNVAHWCSNESLIPSLGAFFGRQCAAVEEVLSAPRDPDIFSCQRCETILHPGFNCTVRVENALKKSFKNNVFYKCSYCSHSNTTPGTMRRYLNELEQNHLGSSRETHFDGADSPSCASLSVKSSGSPLNVTFLDEKKRQRNKNVRKDPSLKSEAAAVMRKRRRKSFSLKDIVTNTQKDKFSIPFF